MERASTASTTPAGDDLAAGHHDPRRGAVSRGRRECRIEFRLADPPFDPEEVQRCEKELERLIVKAACQRARREQGLVSGGEGEEAPVVADSTGESAVPSDRSGLIPRSKGAA